MQRSKEVTDKSSKPRIGPFVLPLMILPLRDLEDTNQDYPDAKELGFAVANDWEQPPCYLRCDHPEFITWPRDYRSMRDDHIFIHLF